MYKNVQTKKDEYFKNFLTDTIIDVVLYIYIFFLTPHIQFLFLYTLSQNNSRFNLKKKKTTKKTRQRAFIYLPFCRIIRIGL